MTLSRQAPSRGYVNGGLNCCGCGAVCRFEVSPGDDGNDERDEARADTVPAGLGRAMEPPPEFDRDVGGSFGEDQDFERDTPPVERFALRHSLRQCLFLAGKRLLLRIRRDAYDVIPACQAIRLE